MQDSIYNKRRILNFAIPSILMGLSQSLMTSMDYVFTSEMGAAVSAAIAPASTIVFVPLSLWLGLMSVFSTLPARAFQNGNNKKLSKFFLSGLLLVSLAIPLALALNFLSFDLIDFLGHDPRVRVHETDYLRAIAFTIPGAALAFLAQNLFTLFGDTRTPSMVVISGHVLNGILNYVLIFGIFTKPLGLSGAALATVLATIYQAALLLFLLLRRHGHRFSYQGLLLNEFRSTLREVLRIGLPSGIQWMQSSLVWMLFTNLIVGRLGMVELATHNILSQVANIATLPLIGLANSSSSLLAHSAGLQNWEAFAAVARNVRKVSLSMTFLICLGIVTSSSMIFSFLTRDESVLSTISQMLPLLVAYVCITALESFQSTRLRANNDTLSQALIAFLSLWGIMLAGSFLCLQFYPHLGVRASWIFTILSSAFTMLCYRRRYLRLVPIR
jgi:multidrug resistance protein, MATE family